VTFTEKRAYAKTLGINTYQKGEDALDALIAEAEAKGITPAGVTPPEGDSGETEGSADAEAPKARTPKKETAPTVDPAMVYAVLSKEIQDKFDAIQKMQSDKKPSKPETPEAVIAQNHAQGSAAIMHQEKVPITIPGGYVGAEEYTYGCCNGVRYKIKNGEENVMVPLTVYEDLQRSRKQQQQNIARNNKRQKDAIDAGI
jgi:hypothetical protein